MASAVFGVLWRELCPHLDEEKPAAAKAGSGQNIAG